MSEKLKPCPFCGRTPRCYRWGDTEIVSEINDPDMYSIHCDCGIKTVNTYRNKTKLIALWNERT